MSRINRLEAQLGALLQANLQKFQFYEAKAGSVLSHHSTAILNETERAEKLGELIAKRWYHFIKITILLLSAYNLTGIMKQSTTFILYHIYYGKICPLAARNSVRYPNFLLEYQPNICLSDFNIALITDGMFISGFVILFTFSSEWFRKTLNYLIKRDPNSISDTNSKLNIWKKRSFQSISLIVMYYKEMSCVIIAIFVINVWLSIGYCYAIMKWFWACYKTKPPIYLSSVAIEPEKLYEIYRKPSVTISKDDCYATSLIVLFGIQILQNLSGFLLIIWLSVNYKLKNETNEFENMLFRLRSYLAFKFRYTETYLLYLFAFK